jgi:transcription antitermination protein NusB
VDLLLGDDMALDPKKKREVVFLYLFCGLLHETSDQEGLISLVMRELKVTKRSVLEARDKAQKIEQMRQKLDEWLQEVNNDYPWDRVGVCEKSAIYLAAYEMQEEVDLPPKIALSEAIRLCRKFGSRQSAKYVNAILDQVYHLKNPEACSVMNQVFEEISPDPKVDPEILKKLQYPHDHEG